MPKNYFSYCSQIVYQCTLGCRRLFTGELQDISIFWENYSNIMWIPHEILMVPCLIVLYSFQWHYIFVKLRFSGFCDKRQVKINVEQKSRMLVSLVIPNIEKRTIPTKLLHLIIYNDGWGWNKNTSFTF